MKLLDTEADSDNELAAVLYDYAHPVGRPPVMEWRTTQKAIRTAKEVMQQLKNRRDGHNHLQQLRGLTHLNHLIEEAVSPCLPPFCNALAVPGVSFSVSAGPGSFPKFRISVLAGLKAIPLSLPNLTIEETVFWAVLLTVSKSGPAIITAKSSA